MDVREFCKRLDKELTKGYWGDIDPYIFRCIAEDIPLTEEEFDLETIDTIKSMKKILRKVLA